MKVKKFCPNCGKEVKEGDAFCQNCGAKLTKAEKPASSADKTAKSAPTAQPQTQKTRQVKRQVRQPMSKKKKTIITVVAVVVVVLGGLFAWAQHYYDTTHQVTRITNAIRDQDTDKLASLVVTDDPKLKITSSTVKPLTKYYDGNYSSLDTLKNTLISGESIRGISLTRDGNYFLFFPKYKLNVESYTTSIVTNHPDSKIYVDGKFVKNASDNGDGSYSAKIGPYLGGKYNVQVKAKASGHDLASDANISLWQKDREYNYNIKTANLAILGPDGGQVYIGNKNVGKISSGVLDLKDFQYNDESAAYVVYKIDGKKFTSKEANISQAVEDDKYNDDNDSDSDDVLDQARNATNDFNSSMVNVYPQFKGAPSRDTMESLIQDCFKNPDSDEFINGSSNKYYKSFHKLADAFDNSDKIDSWDVQPDIYIAYPIGDGVFEVDAKIDYKFEHDSDTHIQVAHYPHITFKQDGENFKILSVGEGKIIYDKTKKD